jgi:ketol-acid reductoisomerase
MNSQNPATRCFTAKDAIPAALDGERIAVLGYGHLGQPFALNLRDSGATAMVIGNIPDEYAQQATRDGFAVLSIREAVSCSDVVLIFLPDEVIPEIFPTEIAPHLSPGAAIVFASGYNLAYGLISTPPQVDVLMLAPRMGGENARQRFLDGRGFYAYISVEQDASGKAWRRLLGLADKFGVLRAGALELDVRREANLDLLVEQTVGAALGVAIMNVFALGVETGIPPEVMVMELYMDEEIETIWRSFREQGFVRTSSAHGPTAIYGGFVHTMQLMNSDLTARFRETLEHISNGGFAQQFQSERKAGYPVLSQAQAMIDDENPITQAEQHLRSMLAASSQG